MIPVFWIQDGPLDERTLRSWVKDDDEIIHLDTGTKLETLAVQTGIFKSLSEARRNGFCGEIPHGTEAWGTKKKRFWTCRPRKLDEDLNPLEPMVDGGPENFKWTEVMWSQI